VEQKTNNMKKREQEREILEVKARIQQFKNDNRVVIERLTRDGITLQDLFERNEKLFNDYNKRWGYLKNRKKTMA
jgi:hypothetical protein